jgi:nitrite reductase/ring-hydroxylating ferredoxin subunit
MSGQRKVWIALPQPFLPGMVKLAFVDGGQILIVNAEGTLRAIDNSCPHAGGSLFGGKLVGQHVRCPGHGLMIDLATGCLAGSAAPGARTYPVKFAKDGAEILI